MMTSFYFGTVSRLKLGVLSHSFIVKRDKLKQILEDSSGITIATWSIVSVALNSFLITRQDLSLLRTMQTSYKYISVRCVFALCLSNFGVASTAFAIFRRRTNRNSIARTLSAAKGVRIKHALHCGRTGIVGEALPFL